MGLIHTFRAWLSRQRALPPTALRTEETAVSVAPPAPTHPDGKPRFSLSYEPDYQRWILENESDNLLAQSESSKHWERRPRFSVIVPVYRTPARVLAACIESVLAQSYNYWELCVAFGDADNQENRQLLLDFARRDPRIAVRVLESNLGISANTNAALEQATGDYVAFLDHDDVLAPFALYEVAALLVKQPDTDFVYSDHDYLRDEDSSRFQPLFKPDWSPEIMFSANYITHLTVIRRRIVDEVGRYDSLTDGSQDWDLFFKVMAKTDKFAHIPRVLYHWRVHPESTALNADAKTYTADTQLLSLRRHMVTLGINYRI